MTKVVRIGIILVIALGLSLPASALDIGLGLDVDLNLSSGTTEFTGVSKTVREPAALSTNPDARSTVGIGANVIIRTSDKLEITPFVKFSMLSNKLETTRIAPGASTAATETTTRSNVFLTLGSAFYWHLVQGNTVELSLGPKVSVKMGFAPEDKSVTAGTTTRTTETEYDKYLDLDFSAAADVVLDVKFTPSLMFRTTLTPAVLTLGFDNTKVKGSTSEVKTTTFTLDTLFSNREASTNNLLFPLPPMSFGLIYMF